MTQEVHAYQHALRIWKDYHTRTSGSGLADRLHHPNEASPEQLAELLRWIPGAERAPVAFGCFLKGAGKWRPLQQTGFLGEFLSSSGPMERGILEAAARGALKYPENLPLTLEEFPSRIWKRALAANSPARLAIAGQQAVRAMGRLFARHEEDSDLENLMTFRIPSGDLPDVMDLASLSPARFVVLKSRIIDRIMDEVRLNCFEITMEDMPVIRAWVLVETNELEDGIERLAAEARVSMEKYLATGSLRDRHHTRRLGRLMFRFGQRRLSSQCAKVLGHSPWRIGWQFQSISGAAHACVRRAILRPGQVADDWMREPALACSAMSIPLWLTDGVERVSNLVDLFRQAADCPWLFPRLQHIYQWHLALAAKHAELRQIEGIAPDLAIGLSGKPSFSPQVS